MYISRFFCGTSEKALEVLVHLNISQEPAASPYQSKAFSKTNSFIKNGT